LRSILVVEDDAIVALHLELLVKKLGYKVAGHETTGERAVRAAARFKPDAVLMDIRLQGSMTGVEAAERILERWEIPVIFVTAFEDMHVKDPGSRTASCPALVKPVSDDLLAQTLKRVLQRGAQGRASGRS
jgi:CheY-like chemotaxis protein